MAALNAAGRGDFSKIDKFPRNKSIGGVRLPTNRNEVQRILKALAKKSLRLKACTARLRGRHEGRGPQKMRTLRQSSKDRTNITLAARITSPG